MPEEALAHPVLTSADIAAVEQCGARRPMVDGEVLYRAGDVSYDFHVVLAGEVEVTVPAGSGPPQVIARHQAGQFAGELGLLTPLRTFLTARATCAGELLIVPKTRMHDLVAGRPTLGGKILAALVARRYLLQTDAASTTRVIGSPLSTDAVRIREFLSRLLIPHEWLDPDDHAVVDEVLTQFGITPGDLPVVISSGSVLRQADLARVGEYLGLTAHGLPTRSFDVAVVGGGPAGLAASVYAASEGLSTLSVEAFGMGGQAGRTSRIENYLGFPTGVSGTDLSERALVQAMKFGTHVATPTRAVSVRRQGDHFVLGLQDGSEVAARAVVAASGAHYRRLSAARLADFEDSCVFYAATAFEARICGSASVVVVGGGNSAGQAAMFLAERGNVVTLVIRNPDIAVNMSHYLIDRLRTHPKVDIRTGAEVTALQGQDTLQAVEVIDEHGQSTVMCGALFSFIGAQPASDWLIGCVHLDAHGFVVTDRALSADLQVGESNALGRNPLPYESSQPGVFAVGDVRSGSTKRVAVAVGEGSACVQSVHRYLSWPDA